MKVEIIKAHKLLEPKQELELQDEYAKLLISKGVAKEAKKSKEDKDDKK